MVSDESNFLYEAIRFVQIILITARVDGHLGNTSWWVVFIPAWIFAGLAIVFAVVCVVASERVSTIVPQLESLSRLIIAGLGLGLVLALLPIVIIALRLSGGSFSTFYILLPVFVLTGILFFGGSGIFIKTVWFTSYTSVLISSPKHESSETEYTAVQEQV
ncbi:hypothetical protein Poli38472_007915 [Pythium oligandrum]|uniref:Uncharacterized protein n=1 Tax=Pythium oligandrum TaxID=41045 RepID=A0A8K1CMZ8_PYTOL|nr:hypothetical protein Poli38472_007915 [Pythium oligandrum]|eukprot:TMW65273.1 hypothetical protein Poli38472_007915 [Pythium oligandrum]